MGYLIRVRQPSKSNRIKAASAAFNPPRRQHHECASILRRELRLLTCALYICIVRFNVRITRTLFLPFTLFRFCFLTSAGVPASLIGGIASALGDRRACQPHAHRPPCICLGGSLAAHCKPCRAANFPIRGNVIRKSCWGRFLEIANTVRTLTRRQRVRGGIDGGGGNGSAWHSTDKVGGVGGCYIPQPFR